jgi:hypothetical protein
MVLCAVKKSERSVKHRSWLNATGIIPEEKEHGSELPEMPVPSTLELTVSSFPID